MKRLLAILLLLCGAAPAQILTPILMATPAGGYARTFNGSSEYEQTSTALDMTGYTKMTFAFWLWQNAGVPANSIIAETGTGFTDGGSFGIFANLDTTLCGAGQAGEIGVLFSTNSSYQGATYPSPSTGAWHHFVFVVDLTQTVTNGWKAYEDGVAIAPTTGTSTYCADVAGTRPSSYVINLMARNGGASLWNAGRMADFAIWGDALNATDAAAVYAGGPGAVPTNLVRWVKMCGGSLLDSTHHEADQIAGADQWNGINATSTNARPTGSTACP